MRLGTIGSSAVLLVAIWAATVPAGENDSHPPLFPRMRKKADDSRPVQLIVLHQDTLQPAHPAGPIVVNPVQIAPTPGYVPSSSTPCVNCSDPDAGPLASKCPPTALSKHFPKLSSPKPALDCLGCGTLRCDWRFFYGSCRAFFNEGRYAPRFPDNCPCEK